MFEINTDQLGRYLVHHVPKRTKQLLRKKSGQYVDKVIYFDLHEILGLFSEYLHDRKKSVSFI